MIADIKLRDKLLASRDSLFSGEESLELLKVLISEFPSISTAFILDWVPEQAEDIYWVLIDTSRIAIIEVPRSIKSAIESPLVEMQSVDDYSNRRLSKSMRRKLLAALELIG
ncbi:hypothetical protein BK661_26935 [Pseudomonas frederiksbergensis]|jgi:hypothetical protein|uniref:Uncharacterized protein n=1 Tax=Pseudomonas frederiksbergensis TaxID=104087 RepID=A0A423IKS4_9PSED|nr:hypothetical protein [Pseudomonas frederiksbergensis]RON26046.1 hypothetical protein BK661_26935 [Pseudomonas frederiksbergensis]